MFYKLRLRKRIYLVLWTVLLWGTLDCGAATETCRAGRVDETVRVDYVYDGDTVRLTDGRRLRFIGINTPELGRGDDPAEPLARAARQHLRGLLDTDPTLALRYGHERRDRHGRMLAHPYLPDGTNVSAHLLRRGYGMALAIPPNLEQLACYRSAEREAARTGRGVWSHPWFRPLNAAGLDEARPGFRRVGGRVQGVKHTAKSIWLRLDTQLSLRIAREDMDYFAELPTDVLAGRTVVARGWLNRRHGRWQMRIRHPAALEFPN